MYTINKNSWHFTFANKIGDRLPSTLCGYVWNTFAGFIGYTAKMTLLIGLIMLNIFAAYTHITMGQVLAPDVFGLLMQISYVSSLAFLAFLSVMAGFLGIGLLVKKIDQKVNHYLDRIEIVTPSGQPSILRQRISDFKRRTCTLVTYE